MDDVAKDKRFSHIAKDPRFRHMPKHERKVKIDKRFKDMFSDRRFKLKYSVDKRGRPLKSTTNENLKKYYELSDSEDDSSDDDDSDKSFRGNTDEVKKEDDIKDENRSKSSKKKKHTEKEVQKTSENKPYDKSKGKQRKASDITRIKEVNKKKKTHISCEEERKAEEKDVTATVSRKHKDTESENEDNDEQNEDEYSSDCESGIGSGPDLARGEGNVESSSSSEEEEDDDDDDNNDDEEEGEEEDVVHEWAELDKNVPEAQELGRRLAVCNMDWDRIKARDIFVLLQSFLPSGGVLKSVKIYPSEYGLQRMKEEEIKGPIELVQLKSKSMDSNEKKTEEDFDAEDEEGGTYQREKLRQYQLNRLKYFYAVVETDSIETANKIYEDCDGMEYESSANKLDLRFIPDDMTFDQEVKSECTELPGSYKPNLFFNTALAQSKVDLTWDETDRDRLKVTMHNPSLKKGKKGKSKDDVEEEDMKAYLASSSDEDEPSSAHVGLLDNSDEEADKDEEEEEGRDEEAQINKYRQLLQSLNENQEEKKKRDVQMEISWEPGLRETTEKIVKKKEKHKDKTPWEEYLIKKKEKRKEKREERQRERTEAKAAKPDILQKKTVEDSDRNINEDEAAFSDDELPEGVDTDDPFFTQLSDEEEGSKKKSKAHINKKKEKKKKKEGRKGKSEEVVDDNEKAELALLMMNEEDDKKRHFNLKSLIVKQEGKKAKKKNKEMLKRKDDKDNFTIDVADPRFKAVYNSHLYNIDPSAKEFKKTKGMEAIINEKLKRRVTDSQNVCGQTSAKKKKRTGMSDSVGGDPAVTSEKTPDDKDFKDSSLANLISSVKTKTKNYQNKIKR